MFRALLFSVLSALGALSVPAEPWPRHTIDATSRGADGVRLADFNGDGLQDVVTGWEEGGIVRICLHPGADRSRDPWPGVTVGKARSPEDAFAVDLDGDGSLDVVSCHEGAEQRVWVHWGPKPRGKRPMNEALLASGNWHSGALDATVKRYRWMYAVPMQVDGRRGVDLVVGAKNEAIVGWLESPQDPRKLSDWKLHKIVDAGWIMSLVTVDMDGDDDTDILVTDRKGADRGVYWLERRMGAGETGLPRWRRHRIGANENEPMFATVQPLPASSSPAVWVATRNNAILNFHQSLPDATWHVSRYENPFDVGFGKAVAVSVVNSNHIRIAHTTNTGAFRVGHRSPAVAWTSMHGRPDGRMMVKPWQDVSGLEGTKFDLIHWIDVDRDGDLDLLTCEERDNLGVFWYENRESVPEP